jgi:hypothetical protein
MTVPVALTDLVGQINAEHEACLAAAEDALVRALEVGRLLTEAKDRLRHGEWADWVEANCHFGVRQAQNYMRAHQNREGIAEQMRSSDSHFVGLHGVMAALAEPRVEDPPPLNGRVEMKEYPRETQLGRAGRATAEMPHTISPPGPEPERWPEVPGTPRCPFPFFGGKKKAAGAIWERLGDVRNYIEPFCGSAAVLLARPHPAQIETLNDADCFIANFWRATGRDPEAVAEYADWPVNEADLYARHRWLVLSDEARAIRDKIRADPEFYDPKVAGWWCWGACCWIGSGWCREASCVDDKRPQLCNGNTRHGPGVHRQVDDKIPRLAGARKGDLYYGGLGVHAEILPDLGNSRPQLGDAYARGRGVHSNDSAETCEARRTWLIEWFEQLRDRLRAVRVCCGDWTRVCKSATVTTRLGTTGIFFDPPYSDESGRSKGLYGVDSGTVAHDVRAYCLERGSDPAMRIVLAGLAGEGHEELEAAGWSVVAWKSQGGYNNRTEEGQDRAARERLWCSPHCV